MIAQAKEWRPPARCDACGAQTPDPRDCPLCGLLLCPSCAAQRLPDVDAGLDKI